MNYYQEKRCPHGWVEVSQCEHCKDKRRIEQLEEENEELKNLLKTSMEQHEIIGKLHQDLVIENVELRKDADRYRWLSNYFVSDSTHHDDAIVQASEVGVHNLNEVIDKIMKEEFK